MTPWLSAPMIPDEIQRPGDSTERLSLHSADQKTEFSSHDCVESNCLIRGLCVSEARRFTYSKRHDEIPMGSGLSLGSRADAVFDPSLNLSLPPANSAEVDVVHGPVPWGDSWREGGVHVQLDRYVPGNFGHILGDEVVALWRAPEMRQLLRAPLFVYLDDLRGAEQMYKLLSYVPPAPKAAAIFPSSCFERFVRGYFKRLGHARPGGPPQAIPQLELFRFRDDVWRHLHGAAEFILMGAPEFKLAIAAAGARLLRAYNATSDLRCKSDICRLAALYVCGGFYVDAGQLSVYPWLELIDPNAKLFSCVTGENGQRSRITNGILGATPRHPIIGLNTQIIVSEFEKVGPSFSNGVRPPTATLVVEQLRNGSEQLLVEAHLSRTDMPFHRVPRQGAQEDCQCIMLHEPSGQVVFYSRLFADGRC